MEVFNQLQSVISGDMIQFLLWFTSDEVQTQPRLNGKALLLAATAGCTDKCLTIIDSVMLPDDLVESAFQIACEHGHLETAQHIAQCGRINRQQMRAVLYARSSIGSKKAVVNWLMTTVELTQQERDSWMLAAAVTRGDTLHEMQLLVKKVGKHAVEATSRALLAASNKNRVDVVDWLTTHTAANARIEMMCEDELGFKMTMTSLAAACYKGNIAVTRQLLHCVTPRTINTPCGHHDDTALHHVIWQAADYCSNPLLLACMSRTLHRVTDFLYVQDVNIQYRNGQTVLHCSYKVGYKEGVEMLLSVFADEKISDDFRQTPAEADYRRN